MTLQKGAKKFLIRWVSILGAVAILLAAINIVCFGTVIGNILDRWQSGSSLNPAILKETEKVASQIQEEGIVLMKNEDNVLPLTEEKIGKGRYINVFGWESVSPIYGGGGSGAINENDCLNLLDGLAHAGFNYNAELADAYKAYRANRPVLSNQGTQDWTLPEPKADFYTNKLMKNAKAWSDTALIVLGRRGTEQDNGDIPLDMGALNSKQYSIEEDRVAGKHYLELTTREDRLVKLVTENFENVIVVLNTTNVMELGWVNDYDNIDSVIWIGATGNIGMEAVGKVLAGEVNPSGRLVDTYPTDLTKDPTWNNFGNYQYNNVNRSNALAESYFVQYEENIYVGYRYYETRFGSDENAYKQNVVYPFGHGLSYTTFSKEMGELKVQNGVISVDITVTNTGTEAGKEVVQLYFTPPYSEGGIEKSSVNLLAFGKTKLLGAGDSEVITLTFKAEDMASYDYKTNKCYVLEKGEYIVSLRDNSHDVIDQKPYAVAETVVYNDGNKRATDKSVATNRFDGAEYTDGLGVQMTRANWQLPTSPTDADKVATAAMIAKFNREGYSANSSDIAPTLGAAKKYSLSDMKGVPYDDAKWEEFLNQLTLDDMLTMQGLGGYGMKAISSVGKPETVDFDGPQGLRSYLNGNAGVAYPCAVVIASTWNTNMGYAKGYSLGYEAANMGVNGWYGPAMNIHRSAFGSRNYEYYSEDPLLSGKMGAAEVSGAKKQGVTAFIKHFAFNEQETNRVNNGVCSWLNEQAMREIYLKPFEITVKEGGAMAVMSSFNRVGSVWTGNSRELLTDVLRTEWGFEGFVLTDYAGSNYMHDDKAIWAGNDCWLTTAAVSSQMSNELRNTATGQLILRQACHRMLYVFANSNVNYSAQELKDVSLEGIDGIEELSSNSSRSTDTTATANSVGIGLPLLAMSSMPNLLSATTLKPWRIWLIVVDCVLGALLIAGGVYTALRFKKLNKSEDERQDTKEKTDKSN